MNAEQAAALRAAFAASAVGKLPRGGRMLDYVGHAAVTDRLLQVDPAWTWEPVALDADGLPAVRVVGREAVLWIRLTVCGVTRLGVGIVPADVPDRDKQLVSDAIRNAAMRFGVALDLWAREDISHHDHDTAAGTAPAPLPVARVRRITERAAALNAAAAELPDVSLADERRARGLPTVGRCETLEQLDAWEQLLDDLEQLIEQHAPRSEAS